MNDAQLSKLKELIEAVETAAINWDAACEAARGEKRARIALEEAEDDLIEFVKELAK